MSDQSPVLTIPIPNPAANADAPAHGARHRFPIGLKPTLVSSIVGLVLLASLAIGVCAGLLIFSSTRAMISQAEKAAASAATEEAQNFFNVGPEITSDLAAAAQRGLLPIDDPHHLAGQFAERLRVQPHLSWIGYGEAASGRYVGATRWEDGEIVEYLADPAVNKSMPDQVAVAANGAKSPPRFSETAPYFVVTRPWFKEGIANPGTYWTPFEKMTTGGYGITCTTPFTAPGTTTPTGLFRVDMRVQGVAAFLSGLRIGENGAVFLVDRQGRRVVSPEGKHVPAAALAVDTVAPITPNHRSIRPYLSPPRKAVTRSCFHRSRSKAISVLGLPWWSIAPTSPQASTARC